ncbi:hypothetical protein AeRB84_015336 [Aphanomyces euteiches]|nr:hypothetical protein AeRB84_021029 [Aphanomyces euteiches]KAH9140435.1 hypothetical protein AeRB84_015336 [Aphanomyces euteiches]
MHAYVHIDEKWFFLTKVKRRHYAYDDEVVPRRSGKSRHFVTKVMFLAAVARPRYDYSKKKIFDGKLGVWPFVETTLAKRGSKNRAKGTPVLSLQPVNSDMYQAMVFDKVIPAIKAKFPVRDQMGTIFIQQDNASPHKCVTTKTLKLHGFEGIEAANLPPAKSRF